MFEKPLLSGKAPDDLSKLSYPVMVSVKLDGIRCLTLPPEQEGRTCRAVTRTFKPVPNDHIRNELETKLPPGLDGELMLSKMTEPFREVSSAVMAKAGKPDFRYCVFDRLALESPDGTSGGPNEPFHSRYAGLQFTVASLVQMGAPWLFHLRHFTASDTEVLYQFNVLALEQGFEGTMVRDPAGRYKFGRSTVREGILLKIKQWEDEEATVIGVVEQMHNQNEAKQDAFGRTERSTCKKNLVPAGTLGALRCRFDDGTEFEVGTGFTQEQRDEIWDIYNEPQSHAEALKRGRYCWPLGRSAKIKHQPNPGGRQPGQPPRFPVFLGWRQD